MGAILPPQGILGNVRRHVVVIPGGRGATGIPRGQQCRSTPSTAQDGLPQHLPATPCQ